MLRSKFEKYKTNKTWEAYRKQRNLVTKLKRKSVNTYFQERFAGGQKSVNTYFQERFAGGQKSVNTYFQERFAGGQKSVNTYFQERFAGGQKSKHLFYSTVKTFLSKKSTGCQQKIVLVDSDKILNNTKDVCDTFNTFFVNVANDIGKDITFDESSHPSISKIKANTQHNTLFDFKPTDVVTVNKLVN
jgi:hypothetical protein